jgi:hypothetical protein
MTVMVERVSSSGHSSRAKHERRQQSTAYQFVPKAFSKQAALLHRAPATQPAEREQRD